MRVRRFVNGDVEFGHGHQSIATGNEAIQQRIRCDVQLVLGEWFLDESAGVPYFPVNGSTGKTFADRPVDLNFVGSRIKATILAVPGVASITAFTVSFNHVTREVTVTARGLLVNANDWTLEVTR